MGALRLGFAVLFLVGCGEVQRDAPPDAPGGDVDGPPITFRVGGTVSGLAGGQGLVLQLDGGNDLTIADDGSFEFPVDLAPGASYAVTISAPPTCPQRICTLTGASGTIDDANVTNVAVSCETPRYRLASHNWGESTIRVTDDVLALADGAVADPRVIMGPNSGLAASDLDSLAFDPVRDLLYAARTGAAGPATILVFANASSAVGDVVPARKIVVNAETRVSGIELDAAADRLYVSGGEQLHIFAAASTLDGAPPPTVSIPIQAAGPISLDRRADRLYVATNDQALVMFDGARQLADGAAPSRRLSWVEPQDAARGVAIDACRDRVYLGMRNLTVGGGNLFALDNASTLDGTVSLLDVAQARMPVPGNQILSLALDSSGHLYFWPDSARLVHIVLAPHELSGDGTVTPDKSIQLVVNRGYGLDVVPF